MLQMEVGLGNITRQELVSMLSALTLNIESQHSVLGCCYYYYSMFIVML